MMARKVLGLGLGLELRFLILTNDGEVGIGDLLHGLDDEVDALFAADAPHVDAEEAVSVAKHEFRAQGFGASEREALSCDLSFRQIRHFTGILKLTWA